MTNEAVLYVSISETTV